MARKSVFRTAAVTFFAGISVVAPLGAQQTGITGLQLSVGPECRVSVTSSTTASNPEGYSGRISFSYQIRTSKTGGSGAIQLVVSSRELDGAALSYATALAGRGDARSSAGAAPLDRPATIAAFGANAHSSKSGDSGTVVWALKNHTGVPPEFSLAMKCL